VNGVGLSAAGVVGGMSVNGSVQLTDAAPDGGVAVNLLTDNPAVQASSPVRVQAGRMSAGFTVDTSMGVVPSAVTISAVGACGGSSVSLSVVTAPCVTGIALSASAITGGAGATGTVTLNSAALTGGMVVLLKSNDPAVQVPAQVTIPAGQSSAAFTVTSSPVMARTQAVIMASVGDCGASAGIIVNP
jgi:trimeric autotransporter adhesin